jgi:16S rRNA processing protein RimM
MKLNLCPVSVGRIAGPYGIKGWVKVASFTDPGDNVFGYKPWVLRDHIGRRPERSMALLESRKHGKGWVARLEGVQNREAAEELKGLEIVVDRSQLPEPESGHYYWADLEGLQVERRNGQLLGRLDHLLETGSADVMVIVGEGQAERHLIPFIMHKTVFEVDLDAGCIRVDWEEANLQEG